MKRLLAAMGLILVALSIAAVVMGFFPSKLSAFRPLAPVDSSEQRGIGESGWKSDGVVVREWSESLRRLARRGSWVGGDAFTGEHVTGWYRAAPGIHLMVTGYPLLSPNRLAIEVQRTDGQLVTVPFTGSNPREGWADWEPTLPSDAARLRIRAFDGTTALFGWLGFSEPFTVPLGRTINVTMIAQNFCAVALVTVLLIGPGLFWRAARGGSFIAVMWPGPLWMAIGGGACWALGGVAPVSAVALVWVVGTLVTLMWCGRRFPQWNNLSAMESRVLMLLPILTLGAAARAAFTGGAPGELYAGTISRTLEVGARSDSRISYHTVQLVGNHLSPNEPEGAKYLLPWHFSGRGPLAGLAAAPIVLATGGRPPLPMPDQAWAPFDREGFVAYRITLIGLGALSLVAVASLLRRITDERRAWLGAGLVAMTPFFWHELYFTWPKLAAAACVLAAFQVALDRRAGLAAIWIGGGYLLHPLALLSAPVIGLWLLLSGPPAVGRRFAQGLVFAAGVGVVIFAWHWVNGFNPSQGGFLQYQRAADGIYGVPAGVWWASRWQSFANTFLPFYVLITSADNPAFNAMGFRSSATVHFFLQYWTAAPFAAGVVAWVLFPAFVRGLWRQWRVAIVLLIGPAIGFVLYWGVTMTGLMREGGHVLFFSAWVFLIWAAGGEIPRWFTSRPVYVLRALEVLALMFVPAIGENRWDQAWRLNDLVWLPIAAACVLGVAWLSGTEATRVTAVPGAATD